MEIRSKKLLKSNKRFWFVLGKRYLDHYSDRETALAEVQLLGRIALCDILDVHVAHDHRNTITLVRRGMDPLKLKVREGAAHNWLGNIRERIFCAREGEIPVLRKKKRRAIRSVSKTYDEEISLLARQAQSRCSRSANDLSKLLSMAQSDDEETALDSGSDCHNDTFNHDQLSMTSSFRSKATSISSSSIFSGSSISSFGSSGHYKRKPRIPVSGFTGRAFLANEKKMVEQAGVIINEDLEYIVQAERDVSPNSDMGTDEDVNKENRKETLSRNVRFNSEQDIYMIENESRANKMKKTKSKNDGNDDKDDKSQEATSTRRRTASFVWGRIRIGKHKMSQSVEHKDETNFNNINEVNDLEQSNQDDKLANNHDTNEADTTSDLQPHKTTNDTKIQDSGCNTKSENTEEKVQLRSESDRLNNSYSNSHLETSLPRPRFNTETHRRPKELEQDQLKNTSNRLDHVKRERRTSLTSINSRDSLGSLNSSGMKDRIFYWKRSSSRSLKSVTISNPLNKDDLRNTETTTNDINSQIDQIANDRLEAVYKHKISTKDDGNKPYEIPKKPLKFHTKQLEKMLKGLLKPPPSHSSMSEIQLRLDSMLVMLSLSSVTVAPPGALYDVPRQIQAAQ